MQKSTLLLAVLDAIAILVVTLIGFATHGETGLSFLPRMLAAFIPLTVAWFLISPWFGLFQSEIVTNPKQLWRPVFAMLFAAPFAAVLRGLLLNAPIIPIFAVVLSATSAFGMMIWRGIYLFVNRR
ncbi:MAG: DUF3054 domain-containing protein [Anaerolineales bacterium]|nr:DUF3054 domain-containing protein [Anaerolineales bacterium]